MRANGIFLTEIAETSDEGFKTVVTDVEQRDRHHQLDDRPSDSVWEDPELPDAGRGRGAAVVALSLIHL